MRAKRFKVQPPTKWAKIAGKSTRPETNPHQHGYGGFADKEIDLPTARQLFANREHSSFGAYQPSRYGMGYNHQNVWDSRGVGFYIMVGGHDNRRGDRKFGTDYREEFHIIDDDADMQEVAHMFALIQRAKMAAV